MMRKSSDMRRCCEARLFLRTAWPRAIGWAAILLVAAACQMPNNPKRAGVAAGGSPNVEHALLFAGQAHADGFCRPAENCSACHGVDLKGGSSGQPSCTSCHADLWNHVDCGKGTSSHTVPLRGVMHKPDYCQPAVNCAACHGATLQGGPGGIPSCTSCHGALWNLPECGKGTSSHSIPLRGAMHKPDYCQPAANCSACHGTDLKGGSGGAPSCTACHGEIWAQPNCGQTSHNVNLGGRMHAADYCQPEANCAGCHGADLKGGPNGAPSCTSCHGTKWTSPDCGRNTHSIGLGGVAHAPDYCRPYQNCASCHGPSLRGEAMGSRPA